MIYFKFGSHRSRSRIGDSVLIRCPVMLRSLSEGERPIEGCSDVIHVIDTDCITFKHRTTKKGFISKFDRERNSLMKCWHLISHLVVLKRQKTSGFFSSLLLSTNTSSETQNVSFRFSVYIVEHTWSWHFFVSYHCHSEYVSMLALKFSSKF